MIVKDPTQTVFYYLDRAIKEYRKYAQMQIKKIEKDITLDQTLALILISNEKKYSQTELSKILFKDFASLTRMVELLVKKGFITRSINNNDRRRANLELTTKGRLTIKNLTPIIIQNRINALEGIIDLEQNNLKITLNKITNNCKKYSK